MPEVVFSQHASQRGKQRKLNYKRIRAAVGSAPHTSNPISWSCGSGLFAIYVDRPDGKRVVITAYLSPHKTRKPKHIRR